MPNRETVLLGLSEIADRFGHVAVAWHVAIAAVLLAAGFGWRPSRRTAAILMAVPLFSVAVFALATGNPFNGIVAAGLGLGSAAVGMTLGDTPARLGAPWQLATGLVMLAFGLVYPHFVQADSLLTYLYAPPTGILPCPTLSILVGFGLALDGLGSRAWSAMLAAAAAFYGAVGVFRLQVNIDVMLLMGAFALAIVSFRVHPQRSSRLAARQI